MIDAQVVKNACRVRAADVGFLRPIGRDDDEFLVGLPFVNVSYRWQ